jgi:predicted NBD/HSP70 family sugar kinase
LPAPRTIGAARLVRLARTGPAARDLLQEYGTNVAVGLANLQQTLGLSLFVVHGDPVAGGEEFRELIEKHLRERAFAHPGVRPRVRFAAPDDDITMRGTAALVLSRLLHVAF